MVSNKKPIKKPPEKGKEEPEKSDLQLVINNVINTCKDIITKNKSVIITKQNAKKGAAQSANKAVAKNVSEITLEKVAQDMTSVLKDLKNHLYTMHDKNDSFSDVAPKLEESFLISQKNNNKSNFFKNCKANKPSSATSGKSQNSAKVVNAKPATANANNNKQKSATPSNTSSTNKRVVPPSTSKMSSGSKQSGPSNAKELFKKIPPKATYNPLGLIKAEVERAIRDKRTFTVRGTFPAVRKALLKRGWVEKLHLSFRDRINEDLKKFQTYSILELVELLRNKDIADNCKRLIKSKLLVEHQVDFYWGFNYDSFKECPDKAKLTKINKFRRELFSYTSKLGLCDANKKSMWFKIPGIANLNHPRSFSLVKNGDTPEFIKDFNRTAAMSLLKWVVKNNSTKEFKVLSPSGKIPVEVFDFAVNECYKFIKMAEHEDIDHEIKEALEYEWNEFLEYFYKTVHIGNHFKTNSEITEIDMVRRANYILGKLTQFYPYLEMDGVMNMWILKPTNGSQGVGIHICRTLQYILKTIKSNPNRRYIIQKYIERPLLIYSTKFDIRQWFLISSSVPLTIWMYKRCYLRFSSQTYNLRKLHESIHLTNNSVQARYPKTNRDIALPSYNMWDSGQFKNYLSDIGYPNAYNNIIYPGMKQCITAAVTMHQEKLDRRRNCFELYGADFMLTEDFKPWLLEINSNPALHASTPVTARMCPLVLEDVIKVVIDFELNKNADTGAFELIYRKDIPTKSPSKDLQLKGAPLSSNYFYTPTLSNLTSPLDGQEKTNVFEPAKLECSDSIDYVKQIGKGMRRTLEDLLEVLRRERQKRHARKHKGVATILSRIITETKESQTEYKTQKVLSETFISSQILETEELKKIEEEPSTLNIKKANVVKVANNQTKTTKKKVIAKKKPQNLETKPSSDKSPANNINSSSKSQHVTDVEAEVTSNNETSYKLRDIPKMDEPKKPTKPVKKESKSSSKEKTRSKSSVAGDDHAQIKQDNSLENKLKPSSKKAVSKENAQNLKTNDEEKTKTLMPTKRRSFNVESNLEISTPNNSDNEKIQNKVIKNVIKQNANEDEAKTETNTTNSNANPEQMSRKDKSFENLKTPSVRLLLKTLDSITKSIANNDDESTCSDVEHGQVKQRGSNIESILKTLSVRILPKTPDSVTNTNAKDDGITSSDAELEQIRQKGSNIKSKLKTLSIQILPKTRDPVTRSNVKDDEEITSSDVELEQMKPKGNNMESNLKTSSVRILPKTQDSITRSNVKDDDEISSSDGEFEPMKPKGNNINSNLKPPSVRILPKTPDSVGDDEIASSDAELEQMKQTGNDVKSNLKTSSIRILHKSSDSSANEHEDLLTDANDSDNDPEETEQKGSSFNTSSIRMLPKAMDSIIKAKANNKPETNFNFYVEDYNPVQVSPKGSNFDSNLQTLSGRMLPVNCVTYPNASLDRKILSNLKFGSPDSIPGQIKQKGSNFDSNLETTSSRTFPEAIDYVVDPDVQIRQKGNHFEYNLNTSNTRMVPKKSNVGETEVNPNIWDYNSGQIGQKGSNESNLKTSSGRTLFKIVKCDTNLNVSDSKTQSKSFVLVQQKGNFGLILKTLSGRVLPETVSCITNPEDARETLTNFNVNVVGYSPPQIRPKGSNFDTNLKTSSGRTLPRIVTCDTPPNETSQRQIQNISLVFGQQNVSSGSSLKRRSSTSPPQNVDAGQPRQDVFTVEKYESSQIKLKGSKIDSHLKTPSGRTLPRIAQCETSSKPNEQRITPSSSFVLRPAQIKPRRSIESTPGRSKRTRGETSSSDMSPVRRAFLRFILGTRKKPNK